MSCLSPPNSNDFMVTGRTLSVAYKCFAWEHGSRANFSAEGTITWLQIGIAPLDVPPTRIPGAKTS